MPTSTPPQTFKYEVEDESGKKYILELDQEVSQDEDGKLVLQELLHAQLQAEAEMAKRDALLQPAKDIGRGVVGGLRDFAQQFVDMPVEILNVILASASPDPPGPPGTRRPLFPEFQAPQLPGPGEPKSSLERGVRTGFLVAADIAALLTPIGKSIAAKRRAARTPMMFEKGSARKATRELERRRPRLQFEPGSPASRPASRFNTGTPTIAEPAGILKTPPSQGARNMARLFEFNADDIPKMSLERAANARTRILSMIDDTPNLASEPGPVGELLRRLEQRIISFR